jgi:hypothetical protein
LAEAMERSEILLTVSRKGCGRGYDGELESVAMKKKVKGVCWFPSISNDPDRTAFGLGCDVYLHPSDVKLFTVRRPSSTNQRHPVSAFLQLSQDALRRFHWSKDMIVFRVLS